jgi:hypothetical protein
MLGKLLKALVFLKCSKTSFPGVHRVILDFGDLLRPRPTRSHTPYDIGNQESDNKELKHTNKNEMNNQYK